MTLVNDKKKLLPITKKAMELLREQGVYLGIASGRPIEGHLVRRSENWGFDRQFDFIIGMNGGQLHDYTDDTFVESYKLSRECVKEIIEIMEPLDLNPFVYEKGYMLAKRLDQQTIESSIRNDEPVQVVNDISEMWEKERNKIMFRAKTLVENTGFISGSDDACGGLVFGCFHESKELAAAGAAHGGTKHNQSLYGYQQIVQKIYDQSVFLHLHLLFCRSSLFSFDNQRIHLNPKDYRENKWNNYIYEIVRSSRNLVTDPALTTRMRSHRIIPHTHSFGLHFRSK